MVMMDIDLFVLRVSLGANAYKVETRCLPHEETPKYVRSKEDDFLMIKKGSWIS
jgi:hypothetical protein